MFGLFLSSPVYAGQSTEGDQKCLVCPVGSVAKTDDGSVGQVASTNCDPWSVQLCKRSKRERSCFQRASGACGCISNSMHAGGWCCHIFLMVCISLLTRCSPPGTFATILAPRLYATCEPCADGFYRSGDASSNNNACRQIPAGERI